MASTDKSFGGAPKMHDFADTVGEGNSRPPVHGGAPRLVDRGPQQGPGGGVPMPYGGAPSLAATQRPGAKSGSGANVGAGNTSTTPTEGTTSF